LGSGRPPSPGSATESRAGTAAPSLDLHYRLGLAAGFGAAAVLGVLVVSTRFEVHSPSLLDDWYFASQSVNSIGDLLDPFLHAIGPRFRPGYELWSRLEWHTLGAPEDVTGPNLFGVLRVLVFVAGAVLVPAVIAATSEPRPSPPGIAALAAAVGVLLFSGPEPTGDFFRLGPQEPLMVGAAASGAAVLLFACGRAIGWQRGSRSGRATLGLAATAAIGWLLWAFGIYQKEASVAVVVLAPFLYLFLDHRWRDRALTERALWRYRPFQLTAAAMLLPVLHMAVVSSTISERGVAIYGSSRPNGIGEWIGRLWESISLQWSEMSRVVGTPAWRVVAIMVPLLLVAIIVQRRRVPWLPLGMLLTGVALLTVQGLPLFNESRYYIPSIALFAGAALLLLAEGPGWLRWIGIAAALVLAVVNYGEVRDRLDYWSLRDLDQDKVLRLVAELHPASCPVYLTNVDLERAEALPKVLPLIDEPLTGPCRRGVGTLLVGLNDQLPEAALGTTKTIEGACLNQSILERTAGWQIVDCRRLRRSVNGQSVGDVLRQNRIVPGIGPRRLRQLCVARLGPTRCGLQG
jgi:hypothetical protein